MKWIKSRGDNAVAEKSVEATASANELTVDALDEAVEIDAAQTTDAAPAHPRRRVAWASMAVYGLLPALVLALGGAAGYLQWKDVSLSQSDTAKKNPPRPPPTAPSPCCPTSPRPSTRIWKPPRST